MTADIHLSLSAQQLADFRADLEQQRDRATTAVKAEAPATLSAQARLRVCQRERNAGLEEAFNYALNYLDELTADVVTFALAEPDSRQIAD